MTSLLTQQEMVEYIINKIERVEAQSDKLYQSINKDQLTFEALTHYKLYLEAHLERAKKGAATMLSMRDYVDEELKRKTDL